MKSYFILLFLRLIRPWFLVGGFILYALGAGISQYLGTTINWQLYTLGQVWITSMQLAAHLLNEYFDFRVDRENPNRTLFSGGSGLLRDRGDLQPSDDDENQDRYLSKEIALYAAYIALGINAVFTIFLFQSLGWNSNILILIALIYFGSVFYSVPPIRLISTGYGELTTSLIVTNLVPAFAFLLQSDGWHRLLPMSTFPLTVLHVAMMISFELPDIFVDKKYGKYTLLVRLGWEKGMVFHNLLIMSAYLFLGLALIFGLPTTVSLPAFLTLPLGLFQIWYMQRIGSGVKPNWTISGLVSITLVGLTAYLLAFGFWTH
jgi:1,4-dihydroxy-2-naphthoate octaprenyltransferase